MRVIEFENIHRRKHFTMFQAMEVPHFSVVAPVDVAIVTEFIRDHQLHFSGTMIYLLSKAANSVRELRWRIRGDQVVEHDLVHPSFTVPTNVSEVFSYCYVDFTEDYLQFSRAVVAAQQRMREEPSLEDVPGRDDYLFMSAIPWVHFTGMSHAMFAPARDSVPRISWGKTKQSGAEILMPVGVQAHHGVVDGRHVGLFFEAFAEYCKSPGEVLKMQD